MNAHLLVLETVVPDENQLHATSHWQTCITFCCEWIEVTTNTDMHWSIV